MIYEADFGYHMPVCIDMTCLPEVGNELPNRSRYGGVYYT